MPMSNLPIKTGHVFIGLAIVMGASTLLLFSGGKREAPKTQAKVETEKVVVPLIPLSRGQTVSRTDITTVEWPSAFLPKGVVFNDPFKVVGRVTKQDLFPGEPIFLQKLSGSNTNGGLPAIIPNGMRAVTISVTEVKGVAGFVKPGDRVDVLSTFEIPRSGGQSVKKTKTVLQDVLVLASAQTMVDEGEYSIETPEGVSRGDAVTHAPEGKAAKDKDKEKEKEKGKVSPQDLEKQAKERDKAKKAAEKAARLVSSVTLALTPSQTETLALAEETGDLRLSLRPETDHAIAKLHGADSDKLLDKPSPPRISMPADPPRMKAPPMMPAPVLGAQVEFIQGNDKTIYNFNAR